MAEHTPGRTEQLSAAMLRWFDGHAVDGIMTTDAELVIRSWNQWFVAATGRAAADVVGRPLLDVFPSISERGLDQYYVDALGGQVKIVSQTLHRYVFPAPRSGYRGEPMLQSGRIAPLYDAEAIIGTITVIEDVSERVASERELRAQIATAESARVTAETASRVKDEFLATLSHEIRTPLNAVLGWTRILLARDELDLATIRRAIEVIDRNASAQLTLIGDMLDMARISAGKVRLDVAPVNLASVVLAAVDVVRPAADGKGVRLVTDLAPQLPPTSGDADRLQQVVWNLLSNAVKFTDEGGRVTISLTSHEGTTHLVVADTGQGIAPAFLPQVFERFKQADPSASRRHGGLGLGLALVKELVHLHGGSVRVESAGHGAGTTFTVILPGRAAIAATAAERRALPRIGTAEDLAGVRVLVVEDDPDALEILTRTLGDAGAAVVAASSPSEAMAELRLDRDEGRPDIIVTDIGMPTEDGYAFLQGLRALPPDQGGRVPAIAVTAYATSEDRRRALNAGFDGHLAKPFAPKVLISMIARVVAAARV